MGRTGVLQEVRLMRFEVLLDRHERGELSQVEAAELLGVGERTFRRWRDRHAGEGREGLVDRRIGRPSLKRAPAGEIARMLDLYQAHYADFTVKHFHEQLQKRHGYKLGYTVTKVHLHAAGLVRPAVKRSAHRKKRPRRPMVGMMLHQDGSPHVWIEALGRSLDLIVTMDDATSAIYSAFLVEEEGTASSFRGLREVIASHGLFCSLYTDRGSHYFHTPKAGEKVSKAHLTQVGRALEQLGIEHIPAYSPQARGRSERLFRTLQDRLPREMRLAGIATVAEANAFLRETYIAQHNGAFAVEAEQAGSGFVPDVAGVWRQALCVHEERVVGADNTVKWRGHALQIPASPLRPHFVKAKVRLLEDPEGRVSIYLGPHHLADYDASGVMIVPHQAPRATLPRRPPAGRGMPRPAGQRSGQFTSYEIRPT